MFRQFWDHNLICITNENDEHLQFASSNSFSTTNLIWEYK